MQLQPWFLLVFLTLIAAADIEISSSSASGSGWVTVAPTRTPPRTPSRTPPTTPPSTFVFTTPPPNATAISIPNRTTTTSPPRHQNHSSEGSRQADAGATPVPTPNVTHRQNVTVRPASTTTAPLKHEDSEESSDDGAIETPAPPATVKPSPVDANEVVDTHRSVYGGASSMARAPNIATSAATTTCMAVSMSVVGLVACIL